MTLQRAADYLYWGGQQWPRGDEAVALSDALAILQEAMRKVTSS